MLFEMSAVMTPSREDMGKVYDKFFRQESGFYVHELAERRQVGGRVCVWGAGPGVYAGTMQGDGLRSVIMDAEGSISERVAATCDLCVRDLRPPPPSPQARRRCRLF